MSETTIPTAAKAIYDAAVSLPKEDRVELIEALIVSVHEDDAPPFAEEWRDEIRRRIAQVDSGEVTPVSWEEVRRKARKPPGG
jgi:putative addiction module component (TIGR02574 family)